MPGWAEEEKAEEFQAVKCPTTTMQRDCLKCHVAGDFRVIETAPEAHRVYPNASMRIVGDAGYFVLSDIDSKGIKEIDEKIAKKEFWMSGADAVKYGFADGFIK